MRLRICLGILIVLGLGLALKLKLLAGLVGDETLRTIAAVDAAAVVLLFVYVFATLTVNNAHLAEIARSLDVFLGGRHEHRVPTRGGGQLTVLARRLNEALSLAETLSNETSPPGFRRVVRPTEATDPRLRAQILGNIAAHDSPALGADMAEGVGPVRVRSRDSVEQEQAMSAAQQLQANTQKMRALQIDTDISGPPELDNVNNALEDDAHGYLSRSAQHYDNEEPSESIVQAEPSLDEARLDDDKKISVLESHLSENDVYDEDPLKPNEEDSQGDVRKTHSSHIEDSTNDDRQVTNQLDSSAAIATQNNEDQLEQDLQQRDSQITIDPAVSMAPVDVNNGANLKKERRELYLAYISEKNRLGEDTDELDYEAFEELLDTLSERLKREQDCTEVRFDVRVAAGKVALQPRLVRQRAVHS